jgi:hypothetical protein
MIIGIYQSSPLQSSPLARSPLFIPFVPFVDFANWLYIIHGKSERRLITG